MSHAPNQPDLNMPDLWEIDWGEPEPQPARPEAVEIWLPFDIEPPAPQQEPIEPEEVQSALPNPASLALVEARVLLERPFYALSSRPVAQLPPYTDPKGRLHLQVTAADPTKGVATLADADILIVLTSLMNANRGPGRRVDPQVCLPAATWLQLCHRLKDGARKGGRQYRLLDEALERLRGTCITTNIGATGQPGPTRSFSLLADWSRQGRSGLTLTAGDWLVEVVTANAVLSLSRSYFDLPGGYARWLYRTARKHAGTQADGVAMRISTLRMKSGSISPAARFRFELKRLVDEDGLPDYVLGWIPSKLGREPQVSMRYAEGKRFSMVAVRASAARAGSEADDLAEIVL